MESLLGTNPVAAAVSALGGDGSDTINFFKDEVTKFINQEATKKEKEYKEKIMNGMLLTGLISVFVSVLLSVLLSVFVMRRMKK